MTKETEIQSPFANMPRSFRASDGIDAAGKKVVNVGYPDKNIPSDGVSVEYNTYENTIQMYDEKRTYPKDFAVIYKDRLYYSLVDIATPEPFKIAKWQFIRIDVNYRHVLSTTVEAESKVKLGESILSEVRGADAKYVLPSNPEIGDAVIIKDIAGVTDDYKIEVTGGRINSSMATFNINVPFSSTTFLYNGTSWITYLVSDNVQKNRIINTTDVTDKGHVRAFVGDEIMRESRFTGELTIRLPRYAAHGDCITTFDLDGNNPQNNASFIVHPDSNHTITLPDGTSSKSITSTSTSWGRFVFDEKTETWRVFDADQTWRWKIADKTFAAVHAEGIFVYARKPSDVITIEMPNRVTIGDTMKINTSYMVAGSTVKINIPSGSLSEKLYLMIDDEIANNPRVSYRRDKIADLTSIQTKTYTHVCDGRDIQLDFMYAEDPTVPERAWILSSVHETNFRVDREDTNSLGVAAIATQAEVDKNKEDITTGQNRDCEAFVTPETLANKIATIGRRGIARLATDAESKATSGNTEAFTGTLITPETLNNRLATVDMRGIARLATQAEANAMSGSGEAYSQRIITPETLNKRIATTTQTGIARLSTQAEANAGTDNTTIITPLTLRVISDARYVNTDGDTMTGNLAIAKDRPALTLSDEKGMRNDINFRATSTGEQWRIGTTDLLGEFNFGYSASGTGTKTIASVNPIGLFTGEQFNSRTGVFARASNGLVSIRPAVDGSGDMTITDKGVVTTSNDLNVKGKKVTLNSSGQVQVVLDTTTDGSISFVGAKTHKIVASDNLNVIVAADSALAVDGKLTVSKLSTLESLTVVNATTVNTLAAKSISVDKLVTNVSAEFNAAPGVVLTAKTSQAGFQVATKAANQVSLNVLSNEGVASTGIDLFANGITQLNYLSAKRLQTSDAGVSVTGNVNISGTPTLNNDAVTVLYVKETMDDLITDSNSRVHKQGDVMAGELIINHSPALTANGTVEINDVLTVDALRIRVGDEYLEIRPNPTTRTVEFVWVS
ncbi:MAG: hypothetical protein ACRC3J_05685 [Culicoidibacterales bacterium]